MAESKAVGLLSYVFTDEQLQALCIYMILGAAAGVWGIKQIIF